MPGIARSAVPTSEPGVGVVVLERLGLEAQQQQQRLVVTVGSGPRAERVPQ